MSAAVPFGRQSVITHHSCSPELVPLGLSTPEKIPDCYTLCEKQNAVIPWESGVMREGLGAFLASLQRVNVSSGGHLAKPMWGPFTAKGTRKRLQGSTKPLGPLLISS